MEEPKYCRAVGALIKVSDDDGAQGCPPGMPLA